MSRPVDVLAVLEESARLLWVDAGKDSESNALLVAKAAVAELIEAVKEYRKRYGNCGAPIQQSAADHLDAALANVGSAS